MPPRKISPLTTQDLYKKLETIETQITTIKNDLTDLPIHIYLSLAILGTFASISFTYLFNDELFWYLSIIGIIIVISLMGLLFWFRNKKTK